MTDLGDRMKSYEKSSRTKLVPRLPILIRVDGKAFHTFTRGFERPFDKRLMSAMDATAAKMLEGMQGGIFAYCQSDEISFLLQCDASPQTEPWFGGGVQKIASVAASMATAFFNKSVSEVAPVLNGNIVTPAAMFDARVWNMPWEDVPNYFIWRHKDWYRNSVSMCARAHFSHKECHGKSVSDMMEMLHSIDKPWQNLSDREKNGRFLIPAKMSDEREWMDSYLSTGMEVVYPQLEAFIRELRRLDKSAVV